MPGHDDGTGTQKADAVNHLCAETGHIGLVVYHVVSGPAAFQHIVQILAQNDRKRRTQSHQHIGSEAGGTAFSLPFKAHKAAHQHCKHNPENHGGHIQLSQIFKAVLHTSHPEKNKVRGADIGAPRVV